MANIITAAVILAVIAASVRKIIIEKRKGIKCIGCPYSGKNNKCSCNSNG